MPSRVLSLLAALRLGRGCERGSAPPGCLFHWGALTDGGLRVTDVWETKKQFEQYAQEKIGPYSQQVGIPGPPQITFYDVHNYQAASVPT